MAKRADRDGLYKIPGSPYWWASFTATSGRRIRRSTQEIDRPRALAVRAQWIAREGVLAPDAVPLYTFDELALAYLDEARTLKGRSKAHNSRARDQTCIGSLYEHFSGCVLQPDSALAPHAAQVDGAAVLGYITARRAGGASDSTIRRDLSVLGAMIAYARNWWHWPIVDPTRGRKPVQGPGRVRWITEAEAERLILAAEQEPKSPYLADWIRLALHTGMRKEELSGLRVDHVNLQAGLILIEPEHAKSRRRETVPLNDDARQAVLSRLNWRAAHCPASPWLFCRHNGDRAGNIKKSFRAACARAGIEDFSPHDLRHTCASWLVMKGVHIGVVKDILRHKVITTTMIYAHLAPDAARAGLDVLSSKKPLQKVSGE